ncbi:TolC family outer membrane protein [Parvularcula sp. IMCC14364]|uniref:TolC family outer membrane protein n=1 Tax=Parvularcula sp. IMCC14364 TaxID=3067902 RepID=UPI0027428479|nr:TolC family outer membrane protein [Parvularcula sp. IMCC14364]
MLELAYLLVLGSSASAETIDPLEALATSNPEIAAAEAERDAAQADLRAARGALLPQIRIEGQSGTLEETLRIDGIPGEFSGTRNPNSAAAVLEQALFTSGRVSGAIGGAAALRNAAEANAEATRQDIFLAGIISTANLVRDREILIVRERNETLAQERLAESRSRRELGLATITDLKQAEARAALAEAERVAAAGALARSEAAYQRVFGQQASAALALPVAPENQPASLEEAIALALRDNPDLATAEERADAARYAIREARGARLPQIGLEARAAYADGERFGEALGEAEQYGVFLTGRMALWNGGSTDAQTRAAKARSSAARNRVLATDRIIREQTISAFSDTLSSASVLSARMAQVTAAREARKGVTEEFKVGQRTRLDILDADLELANAEVARISAERDLIVARYSLSRRIGAL